MSNATGLAPTIAPAPDRMLVRPPVAATVMHGAAAYAPDLPRLATTRRSALLISMPFGSTRMPSIQVGLLTALAKAHGWQGDGLYCNVLFARRFGWERYEVVCEQRFRLLGEWLFSRAAFGEHALPERLFLEHSDLPAIEHDLGLSTEELLDWRNRLIPEFIDDLARQAHWSEVALAGFTSMFEQTCASLALARALKRCHPALLTVFGGANFDGGMGAELLRRLDWMDCVIAGEAEQAFPALLKQLAGEAPPAPVAGVLWRRPGAQFADLPPAASRAATTLAMDAVPTPDYHAYFRTVLQAGAPRQVHGRWTFVPFESARGCWWGETSHCTFCGLNATGMAYRRKSSARVLAELDELAHQYGAHPFFAVDNILDHRYIDEVFGVLEQREIDYSFWYELKANLKPEQIRKLSRGGLVWAQPGIETLSTAVLKLMRKGSSSFINLRFLKWAHYYGIRVAWNVLYGFPGETVEDYGSMTQLMQRLAHLPPPDDCGAIRMDRFSPYHNTPQQWGLDRVRPDPRYAMVYPEPIRAAEIAYYFDFDNPARLPDQTYAPLRQLITHWQRTWADISPHPVLTYTRTTAQIRFLDTRAGGEPAHAFFGPLASALYPLIGRSHHSPAALHTLLSEQGICASAAEIDAALADLEQDALIWREDELVFGLALPAAARY
jgi:ribosomal peptide maturation radical SAM protein 1